MSRDEVRALRGGKIAMVFQDPMTSLNPVLRISDQLVETMVVHGKHDRPSALRRAMSARPDGHHGAGTRHRRVSRISFPAACASE